MQFAGKLEGCLPPWAACLDPDNALALEAWGLKARRWMDDAWHRCGRSSDRPP